MAATFGKSGSNEERKSTPLCCRVGEGAESARAVAQVETMTRQKAQTCAVRNVPAPASRHRQFRLVSVPDSLSFRFRDPKTTHAGKPTYSWRPKLQDFALIAS